MFFLLSVISGNMIYIMVHFWQQTCPEWHFITPIVAMKGYVVRSVISDFLPHFRLLEIYSLVSKDHTARITFEQRTTKNFIPHPLNLMYIERQPVVFGTQQINFVLYFLKVVTTEKCYYMVFEISRTIFITQGLISLHRNKGGSKIP